MIQYILTDSTFLLYAAKAYDKPMCKDEKEFFEDLSRIRNLQRLFSRYAKTGEIKERLVLNHLIVLYNVFEAKACTKLLVFKLRDYLPFLKPFLILLSFWPERIDGIEGPVISSDIPMDQKLVDALRRI
mgnify:CR=1 FL=1